MNVSAQITGGRQLMARLQALSDEVASKALERATVAGALIVRNAASQKAPYRTGTLRRSIHTEVLTSTRTECSVSVGTNVEYAAQVEFGGTIKPKNAGALAIPISAKAKLYDAKDFPGDLVVVPTRDKAYLMGARGGIHYVLLKSVTQPARPYLRPAFDEKKDAAVREMGKSLRVLLRQIAEGGTEA